MKKLILLVGASMILAACGSSKNSQNMTSHHKPTKAPVASSPSLPQKSRGQNFVFSRTNQIGDATKIDFNNGSNIHEITVNGVKVNLAGNHYGVGINNGNIRTYGYGIGGRGGDKLAGIDAIYVSTASPNVVYGVLGNVSGNTAFFHGKETAVAQIPAGGKVDYTASYFSTTGVGKTSLGKAEFSADFGSKKLTGSASDFKFDADITGNQFESAAGAVHYLKGGFFGENAAEIGGVFQSSQTVGAFGGKKK